MSNRIKISLENFKNHYSKEISLPSTGLVRLAGRSGAGKSSILQAVLWNLFGKVPNITTWGEKTSSVHFSGFGLDIQRSKNPNTLSCNGDSSVVAQNLIEDVLGQNRTEFEVSSYVMQSQRNSLLNLSPAEQLQLIHSLAFKGKDPYKYKERLIEVVKEKEAHLTKIEKELSLKETLMGNISSNIETLKNLLDNDNFDVLAEAKKQLDLEDILLKNSEKLTNLQTKLAGYENSKKHPARKNFQAAVDWLQANSENIASLKEWLSIKENTEKKPSSNYRENYEEYEARYKKLLSEQKKIEHAIQRQHELSSTMDYKESLSEKLFSNGEGIKFYGGDELESKTLELKQNCEAFLSVCESIRLIERVADSTESQNEIDRIKAEVLSLRNAIDELDKERESVISHNAVYNSKRKSLLILEEKAEQAEKIIKANESLLSEEKLNLAISQLETEIASVASSTKESLSEIEKIKTRLHRHKKKIETIEAISKNSLELNKLEEEKNELLKERPILLKKFSDAQQMLQIWQKTVLETLEGTIEDINLRASFWLDILLEGMVKAELKTTKKLKSKETEVDAINLEVSFKGQILEKVAEEISGGQMARIVLAFQLALGDLYNSPILMLDEALRGCDAETMEICLDAIKHISERRLVLVVEHHAQDHFFQEVVNVDSV